MNVDNTQITLIPLEEIKKGVNLQNIRKSVGDVTELADSIANDGLIHPVLVMQAEDEDGVLVFELVAGSRRIAAIEYIRNTRDDEFMDDGIPTIEWTGTFKDACFANALENIDREDVDDVDIGEWLNDQVVSGVTKVELAKRLHRSQQWVGFRVLVHERASDNVKAALKEGIISFTAAYHLSKNMPDTDEQDKWIAAQRKREEKISVESTTNATKPNKTQTPGKKARKRVLARAETIQEDAGSEIARGMAIGLRWVEGLLTDAEIDEALDVEESK